MVPGVCGGRRRGGSGSCDVQGVAELPPPCGTGGMGTPGGMREVRAGGLWAPGEHGVGARNGGAGGGCAVVVAHNCPVAGACLALRQDGVGSRGWPRGSGSCAGAGVGGVDLMRRYGDRVEAVLPGRLVWRRLGILRPAVSERPRETRRGAPWSGPARVVARGGVHCTGIGAGVMRCEVSERRILTMSSALGLSRPPSAVRRRCRCR
jgi:hypothetical protein